jgi:hypothetical protein
MPCPEEHKKPDHRQSNQPKHRDALCQPSKSPRARHRYDSNREKDRGRQQVCNGDECLHCSMVDIAAPSANLFGGLFTSDVKERHSANNQQRSSDTVEPNRSSLNQCAILHAPKRCVQRRLRRRQATRSFGEVNTRGSRCRPDPFLAFTVENKGEHVLQRVANSNSSYGKVSWQHRRRSMMSASACARNVMAADATSSARGEFAKNILISR